MEQIHRDVLQGCHVQLCSDLDTQSLVDFLYGEKLFNEDDMERVRSEPTSNRSCNRLLSILRMKGPTAFPKLLEGLWKHEGQRHLQASLLSKETELRQMQKNERKPDDSALRHLVSCLQNNYVSAVGGAVTAYELEQYLRVKVESLPRRPEITREFLKDVVRGAFPGSMLIEDIPGFQDAVDEEDVPRPDSIRGVFTNIQRVQDQSESSHETNLKTTAPANVSDDADQETKVRDAVKTVHKAEVNRAEDRTRLAEADAARVVVDSEEQSKNPVTSAKVAGWTAEDVCNWLEGDEKFGIDAERMAQVMAVVRAEKIDGEVLLELTMDHLKELFGTLLVFGERMKILKKRDYESDLSSSRGVSRDSDNTTLHQQGGGGNSADGSISASDLDEQSSAPQSNAEKQALSSTRSELLRPFDKDVDLLLKYKHGTQVPSAVNRPGDLIRPVHQFTMVNLKQKDGLPFLVRETIKFVCACLNDRTNGTVHFGISPGADGDSPKGQIMGTPLMKDEAAYTTFLDRALGECFFPDQKDAVRGCVRPPKFVEVLKESGPPCFVVEIDVVPTSILCGEDAFYAKVPQERIDGMLKYDRAKVYRFMEGTVQAIEGENLRHFMSLTPKLFELRKDKEATKPVRRFRPDLRRKLVSLLCQGEDRFVGDTYPILVINKPAPHMNRDYLSQNLSFLECVPWKAIFDFDSTAQVCEFMDEEREQVMKIISSSSEFDAKSKPNMHNPERLRNLYDDIRSSVQQPWVFANGYDPLEDEANRTLNPLDWKKTRREGFKEAVRFFGNEIPFGRAMVVFCLFSKDWEVMLEGAEEFFSTFPDQWMCIAEDDFTAKPWMEELLRRHCVDKSSLDERVVSGMPWRHIQDTIQGLQGQKISGECELICSDGSLCTLKEKMKNDLVDLEILGSTECDTSKMLTDTQTLDEYCRQSEEHFYRGNEVTWWNFWSQNHVCKRNQYHELHRNVRHALEGDLPEDDHVGRVVLYHQPGAGGTTLAKNILWELRKDYRCALVRNLSEQTAEQIMTFRSHMDLENPKPVLLLVDNEDEDKTNILSADLEEKAKRITRDLEDPTKVLCVMLVCLRRSKLDPRFSHGSVLLKHELKENEISWFKKKSVDLDHNFSEHVGADPKLLISFNILKENFNPKYIERTVKTLVAEMDSEKEKQLLKYVALLNSYDLQFRAVPTAAFDVLMFDMSLMSEKRGKTLRYGLSWGCHETQRRWETKLSAPFRVLTNETQKTALGYIHSLRITNPLLSKQILDVLRKMDDQTLSDVGLSFLNNTDVFNAPTGMARKDLLRIVNDVLKNRRRHLSGRPESEFPPIIQDLVDKESIDKAKALLVKGYEVTDDPFVAQQVTRVLIHTQNWEEALHFAKLATDKKADNSYLWDTYGRVFQRQLTDRYNELISENSTLGIEDAITVTNHALEGISKFRKVQYLSERENRMVSNDAGYFGELEMIVSLLDCLSCVIVFKHDREKLHRFLVDETYVPPQLIRFTDVDGQDIVEELKYLHQRVKLALNHLEDERVQLREEVLDHYRKGHYNLSNDKLARLKTNLASYFGEESNTVPDGLTPDMECSYRQRRIFRLAGNTLKSIFDLRWEENGESKLFSTRKLALQNIMSGHATADDYQTVLCVCFGLLLIDERYINDIKYKDMVTWSRILYELRNKQEVVSLEPYLFYVMFNWPSKDNESNQRVTPNVLIDVLKQWRDAYLRKYPRQRGEGKTYRKKDTTMFFLAYGSEIHSIASYDELRSESTGQRGIMRSDAFWGEPHVLRKLKRFRGLLLDDGCQVQLRLEYEEKHRAPVVIPTSFPIRKRAWWNKTVFFVIGFTWFGPKAFDVQAKDPTEDVEFMTLGHRVPPPAERRPRPHQALPQSYPPEGNITTHDGFLQRLKDIDTKLGKISTIKDIPERQRTKEEDTLLKQEKKLNRVRRELIEKRQRSNMWWSDSSWT